MLGLWLNEVTEADYSSAMMENEPTMNFSTMMQAVSDLKDTVQWNRHVRCKQSKQHDVFWLISLFLYTMDRLEGLISALTGSSEFSCSWTNSDIQILPNSFFYISVKSSYRCRAAVPPLIMSPSKELKMPLPFLRVYDTLNLNPQQTWIQINILLK